MLAMLLGGTVSIRKDNAAHPIHVLRLKSNPRKVTGDACVAAMDESIHMLESAPQKYMKNFDTREKLDAALEDIKKWRARMIECQQCNTVAELAELIESCWDSPMVHKVVCPNETRTGLYSRKLFQTVAMKQLFLLAHHPHEKRAASSAASSAASPEAKDAVEDALASAEQAEPTVPDEPLE